MGMLLIIIVALIIGLRCQGAKTPSRPPLDCTVPPGERALALRTFRHASTRCPRGAAPDSPCFFVTPLTRRFHRVNDSARYGRAHTYDATFIDMAHLTVLVVPTDPGNRRQLGGLKTVLLLDMRGNVVLRKDTRWQVQLRPVRMLNSTALIAALDPLKEKPDPLIALWVWDIATDREETVRFRNPLRPVRGQRCTTTSSTIPTQTRSS